MPSKKREMETFLLILILFMNKKVFESLEKRKLVDIRPNVSRLIGLTSSNGQRFPSRNETVSRNFQKRFGINRNNFTKKLNEKIKNLIGTNYDSIERENGYIKINYEPPSNCDIFSICDHLPKKNKITDLFFELSDSFGSSQDDNTTFIYSLETVGSPANTSTSTLTGSNSSLSPSEDVNGHMAIHANYGDISDDSGINSSEFSFLNAPDSPTNSLSEEQPSESFPDSQEDFSIPSAMFDSLLTLESRLNFEDGSYFPSTNNKYNNDSLDHC